MWSTSSVRKVKQPVHDLSAWSFNLMYDCSLFQLSVISPFSFLLLYLLHFGANKLHT